MKETISKEIAAKIALGAFIIFVIWWVILQFMNLPHESNENQLFAALYGVVALGGGIWGIVIARKWGGIRSIMGKSLLLFSIGLLSQEIGQILYSAYIYFLKIPVPYPSIGDLFFYGTIPLYIAAVLYLARASGIHISLRSFKSKLQAVLIPLGMLIFSYIIFLQGYEFDWAKPLTVFLDLGVPIGQTIYISLAILTYTLTRGLLGGMMRSKVLFILFALLAQYIADWTFLYQANRKIWYAGGVNDFMYLCSYFLLTFGLLQIDVIYKKLKEGS